MQFGKCILFAFCCCFVVVVVVVVYFENEMGVPRAHLRKGALRSHYYDQ